MRMLARPLPILILLGAFIAGLALQGPVQAGNNESTGEAIKAFITSGHASLGNQTDDKRLFEIFTFYEQRHFKPIWTRDTGVKTKGKKLLEALKASAEHGLDPGKYNIADIEERIDSKNPEVLAELDLVMSDTFAQYAHDLSKGRVTPSRVNQDVAIVPKGPGPLFLIDGAEAADDLLPYIEKSVKPQSKRYDRLKSKLAEYRKMAAAGGWPKIPAGKTLKPGDDDARIPAIRKMLQVMGDFTGTIAAEGPESTVYDDELAEAVKRFQSRHGLNTDAVIGPGTHASMNVPIETRIQQLLLNMERRRWMDDDLGDFYVFVNQADQYLKVVKGGKTIHTALLVVGKVYHRTPVFSKDMSYIVINPFWNVPRSIANKEYLPKLRRDPGSLLRQNIRLLGASGREISPYGIDWHSVSRVPGRLRQDAGGKNALGRIKFMFPNRYAVYIHDTPSKSLFAKERRYFSHGCMRVQNPVDLAEVLLKGQGWSRGKIQSQIASGKRRIVNLKTKIPVHVTYLTAWVNKDGSAHFRPDVYERDKRLAEAL